MRVDVCQSVSLVAMMRHKQMLNDKSNKLRVCVSIQMVNTLSICRFSPTICVKSVAVEHEWILRYKFYIVQQSAEGQSFAQ